MLKMAGAMLLQRLAMMAIFALLIGGGAMTCGMGGMIPGVPSFDFGGLIDWSSKPRAIEDGGRLVPALASGEEVSVDIGHDAPLVAPRAYIESCTLESSGPRSPEIHRGRVVRVSDGDTLVIETGEFGEIRVRLWGIDALESTQPGGKLARTALQRMTPPGSDVLVNKVGEDMYERWLGIVAPASGTDEMAVNTRMVATGQAYYLAAFDASDNACLASAQSEAATAKKGVWSRPDTERPWDYRYRMKSQTR